MYLQTCARVWAPHPTAAPQPVATPITAISHLTPIDNQNRSARLLLTAFYLALANQRSHHQHTVLATSCVFGEDTVSV